MENKKLIALIDEQIGFLKEERKKAKRMIKLTHQSWWEGREYSLRELIEILSEHRKILKKTKSSIKRIAYEA